MPRRISCSASRATERSSRTDGYTRTDGRHNPCYVCHQAAIEGEDHENRIGDGVLQGDYGFSDFALTNRWSNLVVDRTAAVATVSDDEILAYVREDNYSPLVERMQKERGFRGFKPDLGNLQLGAAAFDQHGFARDGSRWVAFNYMPMPSTFWPTNGSTDDVMIRLPAEFRSANPRGPYVHDVYLANLAILEAAIKNFERIGTPPIDERKLGKDLNADGKLGRVREIARPARYVGAASGVEVQTFLYPRGTEFLHSVRYVGVARDGGIYVPQRMKELRYMVKHTFIPRLDLLPATPRQKVRDDFPFMIEVRKRHEVKDNPPKCASERALGLAGSRDAALRYG